MATTTSTTAGKMNAEKSFLSMDSHKPDIKVLNYDVWEQILSYLSVDDLKNVSATCKELRLNALSIASTRKCCIKWLSRVKYDHVYKFLENADDNVRLVVDENYEPILLWNKNSEDAERHGLQQYGTLWVEYSFPEQTHMGYVNFTQCNLPQIFGFFFLKEKNLENFASILFKGVAFTKSLEYMRHLGKKCNDWVEQISFKREYVSIHFKRSNRVWRERKQYHVIGNIKPDNRFRCENNFHLNKCELRRTIVNNKWDEACNLIYR
jgi:hypothetical protein